MEDFWFQIRTADIVALTSHGRKMSSPVQDMHNQLIIARLQRKYKSVLYIIDYFCV